MKTRTIIALSIFVLTITNLSAHALPGENHDRPNFVPDKIKIQLTADAYKLTDIPDEMYAEAESFQIDELDELLIEIGVSKIIRAHRRVKDTAWEMENGFHRWFLLTVPEDTDILKTIDYLKSVNQIENVIPEHNASPDFIPNDPYYANNWGHNNTAQLPAWIGGYEGSHSGPLVGTVGFDSRAQFAWDGSQFLGSPDIVIGIIDTGVDLFHPDLRWVPGYDFGDNDNNPMPDILINSAAHGTNCAGIAAARGNNNLGVTGIAAGCSIMPLKITTNQGYLPFSAIINAITYAAENGVDVCSMSFGFDIYYGDNPSCDQALSYAYNMGVILFASSGNNSAYTSMHYPSAHPDVISIGAASPCGERKGLNSCDGEYWWGSTWGPDIQDHHAAIDIMAPTILPATDIMGADGYDPGDYYMWFNGTSCAASYAAGVAALLLSKYPNLSPAEVRALLTSTATDMYPDTYPGWDKYTGYGMVNAHGALTATSFIWNGIYSGNWHDYRNWNNGVPSTFSNVFITNTGDGRYNPVISAEAAYCKSLHISTGATLTVQSYNLTVDETLYVTGNLLITGNVDVVVNGVVRWGYGATANMAHSGAELYFHNNMYFHEGSNINITNGTLVFAGDTGAGIYVFATAQIYHLRNAKSTVAAAAGFADTSTHDFYINGNFTNLNDRVFLYGSPMTLHLKGNFINGFYSVFNFNAGTLSLEGTSNQSIQNSSIVNNYFNHLSFNMAAGVTCSLVQTGINYIDVRGNVTINRGIFDCNWNDIFVKGSWTNTVGDNAFLERSGTVIFNGSGNQSISNESFFALVLDKPSGELIIPSDSFVLSYDYFWVAGTLRVAGGTFLAAALANNGIYGTIYVDAGLLDLRQDDFNRNDFNCHMHISGGSVTIGGGSTTDNMWGYGSGEISLHMTGGVLDFLNQSIFISDQIGDISFYVSGGTIRTSRSYICSMNDIDFSGGTVELYNPEQAFIQMHSTSSVHNLNLNKGYSRSDRNQRLDYVTASSDLMVSGTLTVLQGTLDLEFRNLTANGGIHVYGTLKKPMGGGIITSGGDFRWYSGSVSDLLSGSISFAGNWAFDSGCNVNLNYCPVTFNGTGNATMKALSSTAGFGNLFLSGSNIINPPHLMEMTDDAAQTLKVNNLLRLNAGNHFDLKSATLLVGNIDLYGASKLKLGPDGKIKVNWAPDQSYSINVKTGATLEVLGSLNHNALITRQVTGLSASYALNIEFGGTIAAQYCTFEFMNVSGVNVQAGAIVNPTYPFHYCTFQNGTPGTGARLLTLNNNQNLNIYGANFPVIQSNMKNIAKTVMEGMVSLYNYSGAFSGPLYEQDSYNRINWMGVVPCELVINDIWSITGELYVCEVNSYGIEIYNNSANPTLVPIRIDIYFNRETMPPAGEIGDEYIYVDALAAWEDVSVEILAVPSFMPATWKTWFRIDTLNEIAEDDETNNASGYLLTTWLPLPTAQDITITYNEATQNVELTWTYPTSPTINQFNIYRSANPYGPFNTLIGTAQPSARDFSEPASGNNYFYQVRAEKTWY